MNAGNRLQCDRYKKSNITSVQESRPPLIAKLETEDSREDLTMYDRDAGAGIALEGRCKVLGVLMHESLLLTERFSPFGSLHLQASHARAVGLATPGNKEIRYLTKLTLWG